jgi:hypothetical protein
MFPYSPFERPVVFWILVALLASGCEVGQRSEIIPDPPRLIKIEQIVESLATVGTAATLEFQKAEWRLTPNSAGAPSYLFQYRWAIPVDAHIMVFHRLDGRGDGLPPFLSPRHDPTDPNDQPPYEFMLGPDRLEAGHRHEYEFRIFAVENVPLTTIDLLGLFRDERYEDIRNSVPLNRTLLIHLKDAQP